MWRRSARAAETEGEPADAGRDREPTRSTLGAPSHALRPPHRAYRLMPHDRVHHAYVTRGEWGHVIGRWRLIGVSWGVASTPLSSRGCGTLRRTDRPPVRPVDYVSVGPARSSVEGRGGNLDSAGATMAVAQCRPGTTRACFIFLDACVAWPELIYVCFLLWERNVWMRRGQPTPEAFRVSDGCLATSASAVVPRVLAARHR